MSSEIPKHTPRKRVFRPADNLNSIWSSKKFRKKMFLAGLVTIVGVSSCITGYQIALNIPKTYGTDHPDNTVDSPALLPDMQIVPVFPDTQTAPSEKPPEKFSRAEFKNFFEKLLRQPIKAAQITDENLIRDFVQLAEQNLMSENAGTTQYSEGSRRRGEQRSAIYDSQDNSVSIALSAHLQGEGKKPSYADIRVLKVLIIYKKTNQIAEFLLSDHKQGKLTALLSSKLNIKDFSFWDRGEAFSRYIPELGTASMEDLISVNNVLRYGKVNTALTKKSTNKLDEIYNSNKGTPLLPKPQPTPIYY